MQWPILKFGIVTGSSKYRHLGLLAVGNGDSQVKWEVITLKHCKFRRSHWQTILLLCVLVRRGIIRKSHIKLLQLCYIKSGDNLIENVILCRMLIAYFFSIKPSHQRDSSSLRRHPVTDVPRRPRVQNSPCAVWHLKHSAFFSLFFFFFLLCTPLWTLEYCLLVRMEQGLTFWHWNFSVNKEANKKKSAEATRCYFSIFWFRKS